MGYTCEVSEYNSFTIKFKAIIFAHLIQRPLPLPLLGRWLANKLTVILRGFGNCLTPKACIDTQ